ncbi:MAG: DUF2007 domain-containing protein [Bdellovibrionota bacterium]
MNWVELTRVNQLVEAYALRSFLEAHEIDVLIPNEHSMRNLHHMTPAMGGYTMLQVPTTQLELARELLLEYNSNPTLTPTDLENLPEELRYSNDEVTRDELSKRALRSAIFGTLIVPVVLNLYSIKLLTQIYADPKLLKHSKKSDLNLAIAFNILGLLAWSVVGYSLYLDWVQ